MYTKRESKREPEREKEEARPWHWWRSGCRWPTKAETEAGEEVDGSRISPKMMRVCSRSSTEDGQPGLGPGHRHAARTVGKWGKACDKGGEAGGALGCVAMDHGLRCKEDPGKESRLWMPWGVLAWLGGEKNIERRRCGREMPQGGWGLTPRRRGGVRLSRPASQNTEYGDVTMTSRYSRRMKSLP